MRVVIAGGHGKIALGLTRRLSARGDSVVGLIRNPDHAGDVIAHGGEPIVCDLERIDLPELASAMAGASAAVFAAGAGAGSGPERKLTVDRDGAIKLLEASRRAGVPRYLIVSVVGAEAPPDGDNVFSVYLRAKAEADAAVQASDRDWTIVRPGHLTDDGGTARVRIDLEPSRGEIPRDDVAAVLEALLHPPRGERRILYVNGGEEAIEEALQAAGLVEPAGSPGSAMSLVTAVSPHPVRATVERVLAALDTRGIQVFARIDHAAGARAAGLELPDEEVVIFGDPYAGTPLMHSDPQVGYELPLRLLVWDSGGETMIGYRPPTELAADYRLTDRVAVLERMTALLDQLVAEGISLG